MLLLSSALTVTSHGRIQTSGRQEAHLKHPHQSNKLPATCRKPYGYNAKSCCVSLVVMLCLPRGCARMRADMPRDICAAINCHLHYCKSIQGQWPHFLCIVHLWVATQLRTSKTRQALTVRIAIYRHCIVGNPLQAIYLTESSMT